MMNKAKGTNAAPAKRRNEYSSNSIVWLVDLGKIGKRSRYLIVLLVVAVTITITITITIAVTIAITGLLRDSIEDNTDVKNHLPVSKVIYVRQGVLISNIMSYHINKMIKVMINVDGICN